MNQINFQGLPKDLTVEDVCNMEFTIQSPQDKSLFTCESDSGFKCSEDTPFAEQLLEELE